MKRLQRGDAVVAFTVVMTIVVLACVVLSHQQGCAARWSDSGMKSRFGLLSGCQVQRANGSWVPEKMLREVQP